MPTQVGEGVGTPFSQELRRRRQARGLSQQAVATELKVQRPTVAQWESGRFLPAAARVVELDTLLEAGGTLVALAAGTPADPVAAPTRPSLAQVFARAGDRLVDSIRPDPTDAARVGWPQNVGERSSKRPSPWSTALAVRTLLLLDRVDLDLGRVAAVLGGRQHAGGWSNRKLSVPRPDVTAVVLATLSRIGDGGADLDEAWRWLADGLDDADRHRPFVISTVLAHLAPLRPDHPLVATLVDLLLAARIEAGGSAVWPAWAAAPTGVAPSVAHTARAVVALRGAVAQADRADVRDAVASGLTWLAGADGTDDRGTTEILRIDPDDRGLDVPVDHFTSAHVVRALLGTGVGRPRLDSALDTLWRAYEPSEGLWVWREDGRLPVWMTHDAVTALRATALDTLSVPSHIETGENVVRTTGGPPQPPDHPPGR